MIQCLCLAIWPRNLTQQPKSVAPMIKDLRPATAKAVMNNNNKPCSTDGFPRIESLDEYDIPMSDEIQAYLKEMYAKHYLSLPTAPGSQAEAKANAHFTRFRQNMKQAPRQTILRLTSLNSYNQRCDEGRDCVVQRLGDILAEWVDQAGATDYIIPQVRAHDTLDELITVDILPGRHAQPLLENNNKILPCRACRVPDPHRYPNIFVDWPEREKRKWPMTHRVVVVDRLCGEAILRGSDIFVKGIMAADSGIRCGEKVAVYTHVAKDPICRGLVLQHYQGHCVFLGIGTCQCDRSEFFSKSTGVGIHMSALPWERVGPVLPPLTTILQVGKFLYAQNLPSVLVGRILDPQPGDYIYDMCGAPGGKTSHLAWLTQQKATIVMSDKSRTKVLKAQSLFHDLGCSQSIYPLHMDATRCIQEGNTGDDESDVKKILWRSKKSEDGLLEVTGFPPESFDKILLDPPCSALGLRPKLNIQQSNKKDLASYANYQKRFIRQAVHLLRPSGTLTYSTCSTHAMENEANVRFLLDEYDDMELVLSGFDMIGAPGLAGYGLNDSDRQCCLRFDSIGNNSTSSSTSHDVMGFFIAKFQKKRRT